LLNCQRGCVEERLGHCDIIEEKEEWAGTGGMAAVSIIRLEAARPPTRTIRHPASLGKVGASGFRGTSTRCFRAATVYIGESEQ
jgi:hypothetical protein